MEGPQEQIPATPSGEAETPQVDYGTANPDTLRDAQERGAWWAQPAEESIALTPAQEEFKPATTHHSDVQTVSNDSRTPDGRGASGRFRAK